MEFTTHSGTTWTVRRRWARRPSWRWIRFRRPAGRPERDGLSPWWDLGFEFLGLEGIFAVAVLVAAIALLIFFGIPLLIFVLETLWLVLLLLIGIGARVIFRRPWTIEATNGSHSYTWSVVGWGRSRDFLETVAGQLQAGGQADQLRAPA